MSYLDNLNPTPTEYSTDAVPQWIESEARRIRRERWQARRDEVVLAAFAGAVLGLLLIVFGVVK
jgi:hypothetical protein